MNSPNYTLGIDTFLRAQPKRVVANFFPPRLGAKYIKKLNNKNCKALAFQNFEEILAAEFLRRNFDIDKTSGVNELLDGLNNQLISLITKVSFYIYFLISKNSRLCT